MVDMEIKIKVAKHVTIHQITQAITTPIICKITAIATATINHKHPAYLANLPSQIVHLP